VIDLHHHCLPGVDDGPRSWDDAVELCGIAAEEGIETIVATPHVLRGRWRRVPRPELQSLLDELRARTHDTPRLLLGSEYFFAHDMNEVLAAGTSIIPLGPSRAVLVELASHAVPPMLEQPLHRAQLDGWSIVLAHPERNLVLQRKPELMMMLARVGVRMQVTASSFTGDFGEDAQRTATSWLRAGLVHLVATDAHSAKKRPPRIREARARVVDIAGEAAAEALFVENPRAILEDRTLAWEPEVSYPTQPGGVLAKFRKLFSK
jgi:protein-tyrosine phosphatase